VPLCVKRFSPHLSSLILRMLDKRRERRPTMEEVLAHPVFAHYPHFPPQLFQVCVGGWVDGRRMESSPCGVLFYCVRWAAGGVDACGLIDHP
jgi:serine/threonine protein kinase